MKTYWLSIKISAVQSVFIEPTHLWRSNLLIQHRSVHLKPRWCSNNWQLLPQRFSVVAITPIFSYLVIECDDELPSEDKRPFLVADLLSVFAREEEPCPFGIDSLEYLRRLGRTSQNIKYPVSKPSCTFIISYQLLNMLLYIQLRFWSNVMSSLITSSENWSNPLHLISGTCSWKMWTANWSRNVMGGRKLLFPHF